MSLNQERAVEIAKPDAGAASGQLLMATTIDLADLSGPTMHFMNVVNGLSRVGYRVTVIAPDPLKPLALAPTAGVHFVLTRNPREWRLPSTASVFFMIGALWRRRHVQQFYLRSSPATVLLTLATVVLRMRKVILEVNGWFTDEAEALGAGWLISKLLVYTQTLECHLVQQIRVVTQGLKQIVVSHGIPGEKIVVVETGTDTLTFKPLPMLACRQQLGCDPGAPLLGFAGNLWPIIDFQSLFEALAILRRRGIQVSLIVAGGGYTQRELEIRALDLLGHGVVRFLGTISPDRVNVVLNASNLVVAPFVRQRNERIGLSPLKIRDYAAAGRPCVATNLPGIAELAGEPWMYLVPPEDSVALADAISQALAGEIEQLGHAARQFAVANFDWRVIVARIRRSCLDE